MVLSGLEFYANGRQQAGVDFGWWSREFTFDFAAEVEFSDCMMDIHFTQLPTTLSTEPRLVEASINDCVINQHPVIVELNYNSDGGINWSSTLMNYISGTNYQGTIPGFTPIQKCIIILRFSIVLQVVTVLRERVLIPFLIPLVQIR